MGEPICFNRQILEFEYIELQSYTGGSETSQYPEEKKSMRLRK